MKSKKLCLILLAAALCGLLLTAKAEYSHSHWAYCTSPDTCAVCGETGVEMQWISHGNYSDQHDADGHWQACENCGENTNMAAITSITPCAPRRAFASPAGPKG